MFSRYPPSVVSVKPSSKTGSSRVHIVRSHLPCSVCLGIILERRKSFLVWARFPCVNWAWLLQWWRINQTTLLKYTPSFFGRSIFFDLVSHIHLFLCASAAFSDAHRAIFSALAKCLLSSNGGMDSLDFFAIFYARKLRLVGDSVVFFSRINWSYTRRFWIFQRSTSMPFSVRNE